MSRLVPIALLFAAGCGSGGVTGDGPGGGDGPFGPPERPAILEPFAGRWVYDPAATAALWESQGASAEEVAALKAADAAAPADRPRVIEFDGNVVTGDPWPQSEYRLFGLAGHGGAVCGKAWHHDDRHDPGDMSKCRVLLKRDGDRLRFDVLMGEGLPDEDDRDLTGSPAVLSDGPADCPDRTTDEAAGDGWSSAVFVRAAS